MEYTSFENSPAETNKTHLDNLKKEKLNFQLLKFYVFVERKTSTFRDEYGWLKLQCERKRCDIDLLFPFLSEISRVIEMEPQNGTVYNND